MLAGIKPAMFVCKFGNGRSLFVQHEAQLFWIYRYMYKSGHLGVEVRDIRKEYKLGCVLVGGPKIFPAINHREPIAGQI